MSIGLTEVGLKSAFGTSRLRARRLVASPFEYEVEVGRGLCNCKVLRARAVLTCAKGGAEIDLARAEGSFRSPSPPSTAVCELLL